MCETKRSPLFSLLAEQALEFIGEPSTLAETFTQAMMLAFAAGATMSDLVGYENAIQQVGDDGGIYAKRAREVFYAIFKPIRDEILP